MRTSALFVREWLPFELWQLNAYRRFIEGQFHLLVRRWLLVFLLVGNIESLAESQEICLTSGEGEHLPSNSELVHLAPAFLVVYHYDLSINKNQHKKKERVVDSSLVSSLLVVERWTFSERKCCKGEPLHLDDVYFNTVGRAENTITMPLEALPCINYTVAGRI